MKVIFILLAVTAVYFFGRAWLNARGWRSYDRELVRWRESWNDDERA